MDRAESREVLADKLNSLRRRSYQDLRGLLGEVATEEVAGPSGTVYGIETQVFWDDKRTGRLRVILNIDDGGWRAFLPVSDGFVLDPDGSFASE